MHKFLLLVLRTLSFAVTLTMALGVAGIILPLFDDISKSSWMVHILSLSMQMGNLVESVMPTVVKGYSLTNGLIIGTGFLLKLLLNYATRKQLVYIYCLNYLTMNKRLHDRKPDKLDRADSGFSIKIRRLTRHFSRYRKSRLERLQGKIVRLKAELDHFGRELVFLSIDVVDSAKMKAKKDQASIAVYFKKYKEFIHQILKENNMLKASWTPDGVMVCFNSFNDAFTTAKKVILQLGNFNQEQNRFGHEFRVRCGINAGYVLFDEALEMEEIASHAIDMAAHVQQMAPPNTLYVTRHTIEPKHLITQLIPSVDRIDGCELFRWNEELHKDPD
ncbi:MAG: hypothetical protein NTV46_12090 [Verrucomicrobia bacterium]|nr:hypothetical protein [Verrucomicrobiota bacterium]